MFAGSLAKGLQPPHPEVFDDLGVIDSVLDQGAPFPAFRLYAGREVRWTRTVTDMLGIEPVVPASGVLYPGVWLIPQWRTDRILHDRFVELGGRVGLGTEVTGFSQDDDGVTATLVSGGATERVRAGYLVGADGGRSLVRKVTLRAGDIFIAAPVLTAPGSPGVASRRCPRQIWRKHGCSPGPARCRGRRRSAAYRWRGVL
jgi:2-polyprenyl-6-methoxyphenol hydroxylase-like FAD-dependent oxidoreductase